MQNFFKEQVNDLNADHLKFEVELREMAFKKDLKVTSKYTNKKACIYEGNNKTYTMMIEVFCPRKFKCEYKTLNTKMPDIDKVMESLRSIKE